MYFTVDVGNLTHKKAHYIYTHLETPESITRLTQEEHEVSHSHLKSFLHVAVRTISDVFSYIVYRLK